MGEDHPNTGANYNNLALNLDAQGKHAAATPLFEKSLAIHRKVLGEDKAEIALCYNNLAANLFHQARYAEALPLYEKALAIDRKALGEEHPQTAFDINNLATNLDEQGKHAAAAELHERALTFLRKIRGEKHPDVAVCYNNLATSLRALGRSAEAAVAVEKALAIFRTTLGAEHPETANAYDNLGAIARGQGKYAAARRLHEKALGIYRQAFGEEHPQTANVFIHLATNESAQGHFVAAADLAEKALAIRRKTLGDEHAATVQSYGHLASNLNAQGNYEAAEESWRACAHGFAIARLRSNVRGLERASFAARHSPFLHLAACYARNKKPTAAWQNLEAGLARGLLDDLSARRTLPLTPAEQQRQQALSADLNRLDTQIKNLLRADMRDQPRRRQLTELIDRRKKAQTALARLEAALAERQVYALERIQKQIPADAALVTWVDIKGRPHAQDPAGEHWACVLRRAGPPAWIKLRGLKDDWTGADDDLPRRFRQALTDPGTTSVTALNVLKRKLSAQRLSPLTAHLAARDGLPAAKRLIAVPMGVMAGVPLEALSDDYTISYIPSGSTWTRLQERADSSFRPFSMLAVGDPVFRRHEKPTAPEERQSPQRKRGEPERERQSPQRKRQSPQRKRGEPQRERQSPQRKRGEPNALSGTSSYRPLPGSRAEIEAIVRLMPAAATLKLLGSEASEQKLAELAAPGELKRYRYLHFATHGEANAQVAFQSAIILAQDRLPEPAEARRGQYFFDGRLTASELLNWELDADMVVLSACQSGLGQQAGGEGYLGFSQALFLAGARSLVVSLWTVDDISTSLLMVRFYENLLGKRAGLKTPLPKAEALSEAKRWLRNLTTKEVETLAKNLPAMERIGTTSGRPRPAATAGRPYEHPYYWAAFILIGDPR